MTSLAGCSGEDFASILRSLGYVSEKRPGPAITVPLAKPAPVQPAPVQPAVAAVEAAVETQTPSGEAVEGTPDGLSVEFCVSQNPPPPNL